MESGDNQDLKEIVEISDGESKGESKTEIDDLIMDLPPQNPNLMTQHSAPLPQSPLKLQSEEGEVTDIEIGDEQPPIGSIIDYIKCSNFTCTFVLFFRVQRKSP